MKYVNGQSVSDDLYPHVVLICKAAWADDIELRVKDGDRTFEEQVQMRELNIKDKTLKKTLTKEQFRDYLLHADNGDFYPRTAQPGTSNHEFHRAIDWDIKGKPEVYKWLVLNAYKFGWVRTVPSERWHWEKRDDLKRFERVPQNHETWDGLL